MSLRPFYVPSLSPFARTAEISLQADLFYSQSGEVLPVARLATIALFGFVLEDNQLGASVLGNNCSQHFRAFDHGGADLHAVLATADHEHLAKLNLASQGAFEPLN
jgi:hypothetical protein